MLPRSGSPHNALHSSSICVCVVQSIITIVQLFESERYEEAALHAASSPKVRE